MTFISCLLNSSLIGLENSLIYLVRSLYVVFSLTSISLNISGFSVLNTRSSSCHLTAAIPSRCARGAYISRVSTAIRRCFPSERCRIVCMLCKRSANLIIITRRSRATERSIFMIFPVCCSLRLENLISPNLVTPSTRRAKSLPNFSSISSSVTSVSSTVSCKRPPMTVIWSIFQDARIFATAKQ